MESKTNPKSPRQSSEEQRISILRKAFDVYDVDESGAIDYEEFKKLLQDLGWPSHEEFLNRAVSILDQDLSGEIEFSEFLKWTEFAYASRILYRHDMYGIGPRYTLTDETSLQPVVDQSQDGKRRNIIRRSSLNTVFEGKEYVPIDTSESTYTPGESSEDDADEIDRGLDLEYRNSTSSNTSVIDGALSGSTRESGSHGKESGSISRNKSIRFRAQPSFREAKDVETSQPEEASNENTTKCRQISVPVREMASMVLSPGRRGMRMHTSRSRSKSVGLLNDGRRARRDRSSGKEQTKLRRIGLRTESKVTVRLRWACGQFRNAVIGDENRNESLSNSEGNEERTSESGDQASLEESMNKNETASQSTVVEESVRPLRRHTRQTDTVDKTSTSESYSVLQEVGVELRKIRSE